MAEREETMAPCCAPGHSGDNTPVSPIDPIPHTTTPRQIAASPHDCDFGLVPIPGGTYLLGTDDAEGFPADGEGPTRIVTVRPFRLARHAVTNADFAAFVAATGYRFRHLGGGAPLDRMEVFHLVFPRAKGMPATVSHPGQEHCYVLSGEVLFHVDGVQHRLKPGDGILIDSQLPHRADNAGRGQAHVLMTVARPAEASGALNVEGPDWWHLATSTEKEKARP